MNINVPKHPGNPWASFITTTCFNSAYIPNPLFFLRFDKLIQMFKMRKENIVVPLA